MEIIKTIKTYTKYGIKWMDVIIKKDNYHFKGTLKWDEERKKYSSKW